MDAAVAAADFVPESVKFGGGYTVDMRTGLTTEDKGGATSKAGGIVYDSTNFTTTGAVGYGAGATSSCSAPPPWTTGALSVPAMVSTAPPGPMASTM